jgi:hypothetical protein
MAAHNGTWARWSLEKGIYDLYAFVLSAGTGQPVLQQYNFTNDAYSTAPASGWKGFTKVVRTGTGAWTLTLDGPWIRVLGINPTPIVTTALLTAAAPQLALNRSVTNVRSQTNPVVAIQWQSSGGAAADPANGELLSVHFEVQLSSST